MKNQQILIGFIVILLVIGLSACTRSVSTSQETSQQEEAPVGTPSGATEVMSQIFLLATQTAMAQQGISGETQTESQTQDTSVITDTITVESPDTPTQEAAEGEAVEPETEESLAIQVPTATPGTPESIVLQAGEFPYCIARRFNVNPNELIRINGLASGATYYEGMTIQIPQSDRDFPGQRQLLSHPTTYTVLEGDTIYKIACEFGDVSPDAIIFANELVEPYTLTAGQVINIP